MQNAGWWYPPFQERSKLLPLLPRALTAAYQYVTPQFIDASSEDAQLIDVAGDSMVLVVAGDNTPKPYTDLTGAIMLAALKLSLDGFELRNHSLLRSDPPDGESLGLVALPAVVSEPQEVEGLRFPFPTPLPVTGTELRKWFHHDPERWIEFSRRYKEELKTPSLRKAIADTVHAPRKHSKITLIYAAKDTEHNEAVVLNTIFKRKAAA